MEIIATMPGWEVRFKENGNEELRNFEPDLASIQTFLAGKEILSVAYCDKAISGEETVRKEFTFEQVMALPENWRE